ncbi:nitrate- and nitrite sensing domain-containing protein [Streptomyces sp. NPDC096105]|uniref:nitrate- and nitrite sensing domain-containing protein n=1 Tax=Streptomyces sp. NPDC096105 TaxID=3366074 RepID=UPI00382D4195
MRRSKNSPEPSARGNFTPPPRTAAPAPVPGPESKAAPAQGGGRMSPRNWRVTTRLNAILLIPVLVGLVMGGFQVKSSIDTWTEAQDAENTARLVRASLTYANALYNERDVSAVPLLTGKGQSDPDVTKAREATDEAADAFDEAARNVPAKPGLERRLKLVREAEPKLSALRAAAYTSKLKGVETEEGYVAVAHPLMEIANELNLGAGNITSYGRTVYAISLTKSALSLERAIGMHLLTKPGPTDSQLASQRVAFLSYAYLEGIALEEYKGGGTEADNAKLQEITARIQAEGAAMAKAAAQADPDYVPPPAKPETMISELGRLSTTDESAREDLAAQGITPENWWAMNTLKFDGYRQIESDLANTAVDEAVQIASDAQRDAFITGAAVVLALLAAFVLAGMVARQMSRSMRQLRNAAFGIAEQRLPMLVDQLSRTDPGRVDTNVTPIPINSTDEIGEVARAFDQVHREAVRLAAEQALLRGNINAIFTNLSRRNQSLIEGQLTLITDLENNEADPDQLENLFKLDHLATRMRRNGENLLVLAGEEPGRRWDQPVPLVDVLRAASSEVEQYERIELSGVPEAEIHGRAVTDLVHLLAELLENATTFSSPQTKVRVTATRLPDGRVMIEIHDKGIGLTAEDFADINHKLANPPTVDVAISQRMGLFVVGRLSDRHGIRVQLRPSGEQAGTTSLVMLPDAITHGGGGEGAPAQDEFTVSQIIPEQNVRGESFGQPMRTAAELGFDDSRYADVPDDIRELDPVGRSLMREGRRAALESQPQPGEPTAGDAQESAEGGYQDEFAAQQQGYDNGQGYDGYQDQQGGGYQDQQGGGYDQQAYDDGRQGGYDDQQQTYGDGYYAPNGNLPQGDGFPQTGGFPQNGGYRNGSYAEPGRGGQAPAGATGSFPAFGERRQDDDWPQQDGYHNGYQDQYPAQTPEGESSQATDAREPDSVGFDRPGPASSEAHELTDAGLPRRGATANGAGLGNQEPPATTPESNGGSDWRSANDERWQQASQLRKPKAGGVTSSGLPRRVPKANLVQGAAETTPQGGPQVSRAPEDVRGRLSNLRRGVQRGRTAGSETNGQGFGPDSTYDQER